MTDHTAFGARAGAALTRAFGFGRSERSPSVGPQALRLLKQTTRTDEPAEFLSSFEDAVALLLSVPPRTIAPQLRQPLWTALELAMRALADRPELGLTGSRLEVGCVAVAHHVFLACLPEGHEPTQPASTIADLADNAAVFANDLEKIRRLLAVRHRAEIGRGHVLRKEPA